MIYFAAALMSMRESIFFSQHTIHSDHHRHLRYVLFILHFQENVWIVLTNMNALEKATLPASIVRPSGAPRSLSLLRWWFWWWLSSFACLHISTWLHSTHNPRLTCEWGWILRKQTFFFSAQAKKEKMFFCVFMFLNSFLIDGKSRLREFFGCKKSHVK